MPILFLRIEIPDPCSEKEFIKVAVREARRQARQSWRSNNNYVPKVGGRPKLEKDVWEACDSIWEEWGKKFPKHNSTMDALVRKVSARIPGKGRKGKDGIGKTKRKDLRTIEKYVRCWIECAIASYEIPDSWLRMPKHRWLIRQMAWISGVGNILVNNQDPSVIKEVTHVLGSSTDKQLADRLIQARRLMR